MNTYPVGTVVETPFYFATRALTAEEIATFEAGGGLPAGVGSDPAIVLYHYRLNGNAPVSVSAVKDATGLYHALITVAAPGNYKWQGYGQDNLGNPVAATAPGYFMGEAF